MRDALIAFAGVLALGACSAVGRFESVTPPGVDLSGNWKLNRAASDDPVKLIEKIRGRQERAEPRRGSDTGGDDLPGNDRRAGRQPDDQERGGGERRVQRERILPGDFFADVEAGRGVLRIEQRPAQIIIDNGVRERKLTPGGTSVVSMANGVADQTSGWNGSDYVIETGGRNRPTIVERYSLSSDRAQLLVVVEINGHGHMPNIDLKRVYDAASSSAPQAGPST